MAFLINVYYFTKFLNEQFSLNIVFFLRKKDYTVIMFIDLKKEILISLLLLFPLYILYKYI